MIQPCKPANLKPDKPQHGIRLEAYPAATLSIISIIIRIESRDQEIADTNRKCCENSDLTDSEKKDHQGYEKAKNSICCLDFQVEFVVERQAFAQKYEKKMCLILIN